jgi:hypothetical protein
MPGDDRPWSYLRIPGSPVNGDAPDRMERNEMRVQITDQAINKATRDAKADGRRRELADSGCRGLRIRITPAGSRGWILGARDKLGQARRFNLVA